MNDSPRRRGPEPSDLDPSTWPLDASGTELTHQLIPIAAAMGIQQLDTQTPLSAAVRLPLHPNRNHVGTTYAGSLFTAAELLGGLIAMKDLAIEGTVPLLRGSDITYMAPASGDVVAHAALDPAEVTRIRAEVEETGRANYDLTADLLLPGEGQEPATVVARAVGRYQVRKI